MLQPAAAVDFYSAQYGVARQRFRVAAAQRGWWQGDYPIDARGPGGEQLSIDVAMSSREPCERALVVSSGLHGVEGFFGSAVQLAALTTAVDQLATDGIRLIFIHALNPYGFAWSRRVDEMNIDLNRNFPSGDERYAGSPDGYTSLDALLNPRGAPRWWDHVPFEALTAILRHGLPALKQVVAGGQFDYPKGLFFGGHDRADTVRVLEAHLPEWIGDCQRVLHLDLHTGLGRWATYQLLTDDRLSSAWSARLGAIIDRQRIVPPASGNGEYQIRGGFGGWAGRRFADRDYLLLYAEFGTYGPLRVVLGLRAENQAHHWGGHDARSTEHAKRRLRRLFCPTSIDWRVRSLSQGLDLIKSSMRALSVR